MPAEVIKGTNRYSRRGQETKTPFPLLKTRAHYTFISEEDSIFSLYSAVIAEHVCVPLDTACSPTNCIVSLSSVLLCTTEIFLPGS